MFIVYINLQILASIFTVYSTYFIYYQYTALISYFQYFFRSTNNRRASGEHKFSGGWLLFLFIFLIHIKDYYNLLLNAFKRLGIICFLRDITQEELQLYLLVLHQIRVRSLLSFCPDQQMCCFPSKMFVIKQRIRNQVPVLLSQNPYIQGLML